MKRPEVFPVPVVTRTRKNTVRFALWTNPARSFGGGTDIEAAMLPMA
ncbi:MAG: hypothetical protein ABSA05_16170 [Opitutaceae bacterium]